MSRIASFPLLAAVLLVTALAASPACTRLAPVVTPSAVPVTVAGATASPAAGDETPAPFPSAATPPPTDPSFVSTPKPALGPARLPLPPGGKGGSLVLAPALPVPSAQATATPTPAPPLPPVEKTTVVSVAKGRAELTKLVTALEAAGLATSLVDDGPYTVFAPTNAAFEAMPAGTYAALLRPENKGRLSKVLTYHVVPGRLVAADLRDGPVTTQEGKQVIVDIGAFGVMYGDSRVLAGDEKATNGVIHLIDRVQTPPDLGPEAATIVELVSKLPGHKTLAQAIDLAGLVEALQSAGPFTLFAPTDGAFEKLPAGVVEKLLRPENKQRLADLLKFHVVQSIVTGANLRDGGLQTLNGAGLPIIVTGQPAPRVNGGTIALADTFAGNGVVHVVDTVLVPAGFQFP